MSKPENVVIRKNVHICSMLLSAGFVKNECSFAPLFLITTIEVESVTVLTP